MVAIWAVMSRIRMVVNGTRNTRKGGLSYNDKRGGSSCNHAHFDGAVANENVVISVAEMVVGDKERSVYALSPP